MTLGSLHSEFLTFLKGMGRSKATATSYASDFRVFVNFLGRDDTRMLMPEVVMRYPEWLTEKGFQATGIGRRIASVSSFCDYLVRRKIIASNPFRGLPRPKVSRALPKPVPPIIVERLVAVPMTPMERALFLVMLDGGLRVGEVENLHLFDVDFASKTLVVRAGKGDKDRAVPMTQRLMSALRAWLDDRGLEAGPMFVGKQKETVGRKAIGRMLDRIAERAKVDRFNPHRLRHTFGTNMARYLNIFELQSVLGHSDPKTTQRYCAVVAGNVRAAFEKAELRDTGNSPVSQQNDAPNPA